MSTAAKQSPLSWDHLNAVLDDARERWLEKERAKAQPAVLVLVREKDSSQEKEAV